MIESANVEKLDKKDWIVLRLLHYILSTDTSSPTVDDISRSLRYMNIHHGPITVQKAMSMIYRDQIIKGEYDNPSSQAMRALARQAVTAVTKAKIGD